jgi:HlyD family secretion protein
VRFFRVAPLMLSLVAVGCHSRPTVERRASGTEAHQPLAPDQVVAPGIVEPWDGEVRIAPNEQGQISEVLVREGDVVVAGQTLLRLDDALQAHAVEMARAELAEARAMNRRTIRGSTPEELALARGEREAASARADQARREAARTRSLSDAGGVPLAEAERSESESRALAASLASADARLGTMVRGSRAEDRDAAEARVSAAVARLATAEAALARRRIAAPRAGTVLWSRWHVGELFIPGSTPLLVLGDTHRLQIRLEVDELDAGFVSAGMPCQVFTDVGERVSGCRVERLSPAFGRRTLAFEAPTSRTDVRIREVFVEIDAVASIAPGQRLWVHVSRAPGSAG